LLWRLAFASVVWRQVSPGKTWENNMKAPEHESPEIVRKAIAALKEQKDQAQSHLKDLKLLKLTSCEQFEAAKAAHLAEAGEFDKMIAAAERKLKEAEATLVTFERIAGQIEGTA
jgi:hypothetical protein